MRGVVFKLRGAKIWGIYFKFNANIPISRFMNKICHTAYICQSNAFA